MRFLLRLDRVSNLGLSDLKEQLLDMLQFLSDLLLLELRLPLGDGRVQDDQDRKAGAEDRQPSCDLIQVH